MKTILHLNSYLVDNNLYSNIYKRLDGKYKQNIFVPIKRDRELKIDLKLSTGILISSKIIRKNHTFFYFNKIDLIYKELINQNVHVGVDMVHAHNLFVDGAVALRLKKEMGIDYIVAIRMTDVDLQYRYMIHRRKMANEILSNAVRIIFISPIYKDKLFRQMNKRQVSYIENKCLVIPNGIDDFWYSTQSKITPYLGFNSYYNILYIGKIQKSKNVIELIKAVDSLSSLGEYKVKLTIIGGFHPNEKKYESLFKKVLSDSKETTYLGYVADKMQILNILRNTHLMALPAKNELFGLVYIEALSQNTPVLFCSNEGISPFLINKPYAYQVDSNSFSNKTIIEAIEASIRNYPNLSTFSDYSQEFSWEKIIDDYLAIYETL